MVLLIQMLVASSPFGLLALAGVRGKLAWAVAIILTIAFWGFYLSVGLKSVGAPPDANIGLGLLMLASPAVIAAAAFGAATYAKRNK